VIDWLNFARTAELETMYSLDRKDYLLSEMKSVKIVSFISKTNS